MSKEVSAIANSPIMWAITMFALVVVCTQAGIFMKKSFEAGRKMGITNDIFKNACKAACLSTIGPSLVVVSTLVSLLINVGGPTALMRLSYIGDVRYELQGATLAAKAYGKDLTPANMTPEILFCAIAAMGIGCVGFLIFTNVFINQMDKIRMTMVGGKTELLGFFTSAAICGAIAYFNAGYIVYPDPKVVAMLVGFVIMTVLTIVERKSGKRWIRSWSLTIAMFGGMAAAALSASAI